VRQPKMVVIKSQDLTILRKIRVRKKIRIKWRGCTFVK
jgi:hypothetical protein